MTTRLFLKHAASIALIVGGFYASDSNAATYTWGPTAGGTYGWNNTTTTSGTPAATWDQSVSDLTLFPGNGGDLSPADNDVANMFSKNRTGNQTIRMNGVNAVISEMDIGDSATAESNPVNMIINNFGGGSLTFKKSSGLAILHAIGPTNRTEQLNAPINFASDTRIIAEQAAANGGANFLEITGAVTGSGNLTFLPLNGSGADSSVPFAGGTGASVIFFDGDISGYTGTMTFDSTGTNGTNNNGMRLGFLGGANAQQTTLNLTGPTSGAGKVGIATIELGALTGTGGVIQPYAATNQTLKVGYKNNAADSFSGVLSNNNAFVLNLEKQGTGIQTLGGNNTYTGTTTVSGGTLKLSSTGAINSTPSIKVVSGANFDVSDFNGIGGYTLPNNVTLKGNGTITGNVNAGSTHTIAPGDSSAATLNFSGNLSLTGGAALNFDLGTTAGGSNDHIADVTNLSLSGSTTFNFNATGGVGPGSYHLIDYTGTLAGGVGNLSYSGLTAGGRQTVGLSTTAVSHAVTLEVTGFVGNLTWIGTNNNNWDNGVTLNNWSGETDNHFFNGDNVTFTNTASSFTPNLASNVSPGNVTFTNTSNAYTVDGTGNLSVGGNVVVGAGSVTIANNGTFGVAGSFTQNASGGTTIANTGSFTGIVGPITLNGTLNVNVSDFTEAAAISGSGIFHKQGASTGTLSGNNSGFTGSIFVDGGTLKADSATALGANGVVTTVANGATFDLNGQDLVGATVTAQGTGVSGVGGVIDSVAGFHHLYQLNLTNDLTVSTPGSAILAIDNVNNFSPPGASLNGNGKNLTVLLGVGGVNKSEFDLHGIGNVNLNNITIGNNGTLGGGTVFISGSTSLGSTGTLIFQNLGRLGFTDPGISLNKPITVDSSAAMAEIVTFANNAVDSNINIQGTQLQTTTRFTGAGIVTLTLNGQLTGSGGLTVHSNGNSTSRSGVVAITSDTNNYQGITTVGGGTTLNSTGFYNILETDDRMTLSVGNGGTTGVLGTGDVSVSTSAKLRFNRSNTLTVSNNISGSGAVEQNGTGTTILTNTTGVNANTYTGTTTVNAGTLQFAKPASFYAANTGSWTSTNVIVNAGGVLAFNVGGASEFQATDIDTIENQIIAGTTAIGGFKPGASLGLNTSGGNFTYSNSITDANGNSIGLVKSGANTLSLDGGNFYTGTTSISSGTLALTASGTINFSNAINVAGGTTYDVSAVIGYTLGGAGLPQTLKGNGSVTGSVTVAGLGTVAPGNSVGQLAVSGNADFSTGGTYAWQLGALSTTSPGTNFDQFTVGGDLALGGGSVLALDFSLLASGLQPAGGDAFWNSSHSWKVVDTGTNTGGLNFGFLTGQAGPGTWDVTLGSGANSGDVFLNYTIASLLTGDVNGDNIVNQLDLNVVFGNWLSTGAVLAQGDANGDGVINQLDINTITGNWLATGPAGGLSANSVPEPAAVTLLGLGMIGLLGFRRRNGK